MISVGLLGAPLIISLDIKTRDTARAPPLGPGVSRSWCFLTSHGLFFKTARGARAPNVRKPGIFVRARVSEAHSLPLAAAESVAVRARGSSSGGLSLIKDLIMGLCQLFPPALRAGCSRRCRGVAGCQGQEIFK